jgi:hypothetical protein
MRTRFFSRTCGRKKVLCQPSVTNVPCMLREHMQDETLVTAHREKTKGVDKPCMHATCSLFKLLFTTKGEERRDKDFS